MYALNVPPAAVIPAPSAPTATIPRLWRSNSGAMPSSFWDVAIWIAPTTDSSRTAAPAHISARARSCSHSEVRGSTAAQL